MCPITVSLFDYFYIINCKIVIHGTIFFMYDLRYLFFCGLGPLTHINYDFFNKNLPQTSSQKDIPHNVNQLGKTVKLNRPKSQLPKKYLSTIAKSSPLLKVFQELMSSCK